MPELPEVETVVRYLRPLLVGERITNVIPTKDATRVVEGCDLGRFRKKISNQKVFDVSRRAKLTLIHLETGIIGIHLRMTGRLAVISQESQRNKYVRASFCLSNGYRLIFSDVRKFGRVYLFRNLDEVDSLFGVEPLGAEFTLSTLKDLLSGSPRQIKALLLDQRKIAGIGNIYADEALWSAKIHPIIPANKISDQQLRALHRAIPRILQSSIDRNGTTFQSFAFGEDASGEFLDQLKVFGRTDNPCPRCKTKIIKIRVQQRGTHLCPNCQRA